MRINHLASILFAVTPAVAMAQTPLPQQPVLSIELVSAKPETGIFTAYDRLGFMPTTFRLSGSPLMKGAIWKPFIEGATTSKVVGRETHVLGKISGIGSLGAACGPNMAWARSYLQFRKEGISISTTFVSSMKGDSACVGLPG